MTAKVFAQLSPNDLRTHSGPREFRFVDLFAGIGGFHHALTDVSSGFAGHCVMAVEIDEACQNIYRKVLGEPQEGGLVGNIRDLTRRPMEGEPDSSWSERPIDEIVMGIPDHEVLCAGFPCQPFSKSGAQQGIRDKTRGTLFFDIMEIVRAKRPRFLILENVRNIAGPRHRDTWNTIIESIRNEGYAVCDRPLILSPHNLREEDGGAPQVRERVFILAVMPAPGFEPEGMELPLLVEKNPSEGWDPNEWNVIDQIIQDNAEIDYERYRLRADERSWLEAWDEFVRLIPDETLPGFPIWVDAFMPVADIEEDTPPWKANFLQKNSQFYLRHQTLIDDWLDREWGPDRHRVGDFPRSRRKLEWQARSAQPSRTDRNLFELAIQFRPSGIRVKPANYLPALVAMNQTPVIGKRGRRITPREGARLQGLPEDIFDSGVVTDAVAYRQLGNSVNVGVVQHVAAALFDHARNFLGVELSIQEMD